MNTNKKYYINKDDLITVDCQECKKTRVLSVGKFRNKKHTLNIKCSCGNLFSVDIEFRGFYRKKTNIIGKYWNIALLSDRIELNSSDIISRSCVIIDLTVGGIAFKINNDSSISENDHLVINFTLDNKEKNEIERSLKVCHIDHVNGIVGGEFLPTKIASYDKYIYFYLK